MTRMYTLWVYVWVFCVFMGMCVYRVEEGRAYVRVGIYGHFVDFTIGSRFTRRSGKSERGTGELYGPSRAMDFRLRG